MSEKEKDIGRKLSENFSKLERENQKYILGIAEGMAMVKESNKDKQLQEV